MLTVVITTSHWPISFWAKSSRSWVCTAELFFMANAATNRDIPSNRVEIPIQIHAHVLDSLLGTQIIIIAKINNNHHSHTIHHHRGCCSLLFIQNIISITHLIKAHRANIHIIIVHTNWEYEKISMTHNNVSKNPPIQSSRDNSLFLFLNALMMADIPVVNKKNHNTISINFQNILGAHIVIIQKIITMIDKLINNQYGRACVWLLFSMFYQFIKNKVTILFVSILKFS